MNDMLNHEFTLREKLLLLLCAVIGLGIFYYEIAYKDFRNSLNMYNMENLQNEIIISQAQLARKQTMERYLQEHKDDVRGELAEYNNQAAEINELGWILFPAEDISISWSDPTLTDKTVRRNANVSFAVSSGYDSVINIIEGIDNCRYRCIISNIGITSEHNTVLEDSSRIRVNLTVTFFETVNENTSLQGLTVTGH